MLMSMLGGGATTIPTLKRVRLPMSMLGGGGPSWDYKRRKARSFLKWHSP